jgi:hypothetical protein
LTPPIVAAFNPAGDILISPKVWKLIESEKLKGIEVEIARLA